MTSAARGRRCRASRECKWTSCDGICADLPSPPRRSRLQGRRIPRNAPASTWRCRTSVTRTRRPRISRRSPSSTGDARWSARGSAKRAPRRDPTRVRARAPGVGTGSTVGASSPREGHAVRPCTTPRPWATLEPSLDASSEANTPTKKTFYPRRRSCTRRPRGKRPRSWRYWTAAPTPTPPTSTDGRPCTARRCPTAAATSDQSASFRMMNPIHHPTNPTSRRYLRLPLWT
mmetsp:Transcript_7499/g.33907  ORF Transcript_7499/g.33907 Transcript_7499/m.33907 type:complete len:231 (-) Transcript_7499:2528-3220(-)